MSFRSNMRYMNPYDLHKRLINEYVLRRPGDTRQFARDTSRDKRDLDVIKDNHKFLWDEDDEADTWEKQFARKYYDKLFKEYCIGDLSRFKENKIALRWRTEQEVVIGKGQFICADKRCSEKENLRTYEVNFAYMENECKKNALVKIRVCPECSRKLNYHSRKKEVKRLKGKPKDKKSDVKAKDVDVNPVETPVRSGENKEGNKANQGDSPWKNVTTNDVKTRDDEMEEYLNDLLL